MRQDHDALRNFGLLTVAGRSLDGRSSSVALQRSDMTHTDLSMRFVSFVRAAAGGVLGFSPSVKNNTD
jgi:hypothetical protein